MKWIADNNFSNGSRYLTSMSWVTHLILPKYLLPEYLLNEFVRLLCFSPHHLNEERYRYDLQKIEFAKWYDCQRNASQKGAISVNFWKCAFIHYLDTHCCSAQQALYKHVSFRCPVSYRSITYGLYRYVMYIKTGPHYTWNCDVKDCDTSDHSITGHAHKYVNCAAILTYEKLRLTSQERASYVHIYYLSI